MSLIGSKACCFHTPVLLSIAAYASSLLLWKIFISKHKAYILRVKVTYMWRKQAAMYFTNKNSLGMSLAYSQAIKIFPKRWFSIVSNPNFITMSHLWLPYCMGKTKASITILCCPLAPGNTLFPDCAFFSVNLRSRSASEKLPFSSSSFGQRSGAYYKAQLGRRASYGSMSWCAPHWTRALVGTQELNLSLRYLKLVIL